VFLYQQEEQVEILSLQIKQFLAYKFSKLTRFTSSAADQNPHEIMNIMYIPNYNTTRD